MDNRFSHFFCLPSLDPSFSFSFCVSYLNNHKELMVCACSWPPPHGISMGLFYSLASRGDSYGFNARSETSFITFDTERERARWTRGKGREREEESARAQGHVITYPGTNYNMSSFLPEAGWTGRVARVVALTLLALPPPLPPTLPSILFHFLSSKSPPFSLPRLEGRILEN